MVCTAEDNGMAGAHRGRAVLRTAGADLPKQFLKEIYQPVQVDAGAGMAAVMTAGGRVFLTRVAAPERQQKGLQLVRRRPEQDVLMARVTVPDARAVAVGDCFPGSWALLTADGRCRMPDVTARLQTERGWNLSAARAVEQWQDVAQLAVSDAVFGLQRDGTVLYAPLRAGGSDPYPEVWRWRRVRRLVTSLQDGVAGLTEDGGVLLAGEDLLNKGYDRLLAGQDVRDLCFTGSEAEAAVWLDGDGRLHGTLPLDLPPEPPRFDQLRSAFNYTVVARTCDGRLVPVLSRSGLEPVRRWRGVRSYAVGAAEDGQVFVVAVCEAD